MMRNKSFKKNGTTKQKVKKSNIATKLNENLSINGTTYVGDYTFSCGNTVPVYEVITVHGLNQLIGHAKFNNQTYGKVYYRGEARLHETLLPSLLRKMKNTSKASETINKISERFINDEHMKNELKVNRNEIESSRIKIEGMLQHYGVATRYIDVVDNHWIALWMGLNRAGEIGQFNKYYHYTERSIPLVEFAKGEKISNELLFQYVLLVAVPFSTEQNLDGIQMSEDYIEVDLRQALPSTFLRPHAQHGLVIRKKLHMNGGLVTNNMYDMASAVIGIIKVRIDRVRDWIGSGELLTQNNLFPSPAYDYGYDLLLSRPDLLEEFKDKGFEIVRYV